MTDDNTSDRHTTWVFIGASSDIRPSRQCYCKGKTCAVCLTIEQRQTRRRLGKEWDRERDSVNTDCYHIIFNPYGSCTSSSLRHELRRHLKAFTDLRELRSWRGVSGGFYRAEATQNPVTQLWHPHIHAVVSATALDADALQGDWYRLAQSTDVKVIRKADDDAIDALLWYVASPPQLANHKGKAKLGEDALYEFNRLTCGMKLKQLIGTWKANGRLTRGKKTEHTIMSKAEPQRSEATASNASVCLHSQRASNLLAQTRARWHRCNGDDEQQTSLIKSLAIELEYYRHEYLLSKAEAERVADLLCIYLYSAT
jgi:hypothetical protein